MARWNSSRRREALPDNWRTEIRPRILERDGWRCTAPDGEAGRRCIHLAEEVDHIIPHHMGGSDDDENLTSLCSYHHSLKSSQEGHAARAAQRAKRLRPNRMRSASRKKR